MKLDSILSLRQFVKSPSFQIVYEWEDIIARELKLPILYDKRFLHKIYRRFENNKIVDLYQFFVKRKNGKRLFFVMEASTIQKCLITKNTIPVIIDFWLNEEDFPNFFHAYKEAPLILITNKEVYDLLIVHHCPIPIKHWPLSFPDQYRLETSVKYEKDIDFCIFGRPNPFFVRLLDRYCEKHPDFSYISNNGDITNRCYIDNKGNIIAKDNGRESYFSMMRRTRVSCYSTPGIDESKKISNKYNQVTPRLFELLCAGCWVIGHYPNTADTCWYQLDSIVPNVDCFEQFDEILTKMLKTPAPINKYAEYMLSHYTSARIPSLQNFFKE